MRDKGIQNKRFIQITDVILLGSIILIFVLKFHLLYLININWDEYTFLSVIYSYKNGILRNALFSFHVHLFDWLPLMSTNETSQIFSARVVIFFLQVTACFFTYFIARNFITRSAALFSVLCYLSFSNTIEHGTSFRFDPICVFLFLPSVYLLIRNYHSVSYTVLSGLLMALSLIISLKAIFHVFSILALFSLLLIMHEDQKRVLLHALIFSFTLVSGFFLLYFYHDQTLKGNVHMVALNQITSLPFDVFDFKNFFPRRVDFLFSIYENFLIWFFMIAGIFISVYRVTISDLREKNKYLMFSFLFSLFPLLFYKYSYSYFYVFILSPPIIYCGVYFDNIFQNFIKKRALISLVVIIISTCFIFLNFLRYFDKNNFDQNVSQKELVDSVHMIFPDPVPYIDRCFMISSYPHVGFQMTAFDLKKYAMNNTTTMRDILFHKNPVFLIENIGTLDLSSPFEKAKTIGNFSLLQEDFMTLKRNFIPHWGRLYVAGKHFIIDPGEKSKRCEILVQGTYTIEAAKKIMIDGMVYQPGDKVSLEKRLYDIRSESTPQEVILRWGENLPRPANNPSDQAIFFGYYWRKGVFP